VSFKELFKAFTLVLAHLFYDSGENRIMIKTLYRTKWLMSKDPDLHPRSKQ